MAGVPAYSAARSGVLGDPGAVDHADQVNQFLGTHGIAAVYTGTAVVGPTGTGATPAALNLGLDDYDQPFTMSGTTVGRVTIPVSAFGSGADLVVSLCPDSSGTPGAPLVSTRIAAAWFAALAATGTLAAGSAAPLATAVTNSLTIGPGQMVTYSTAAVTTLQASLNFSAVVTVGNNLFLLGGQDSGGNAVASVLTIGYAGGNTLAPAIPQPSLPQALTAPAAGATPDTLVVAGGSTTGVSPAVLATVYTASLNPNTGAVGAWSPQASLPQPINQAAYASFGQHVYVIGGSTTGNVGVSTVYWATVTNGQITAWNTGPQFPESNTGLTSTVVNGYLVVGNASTTNRVYYSKIEADGSLTGWIAGPQIPYFNSVLMTAIPGAGLAFLDYIRGTPVTPVTETFAFGSNGPAATFQVQKNGIPVAGGPPLTITAFQSGTGTWQLFGLYNNQYWTQTLTLTPSVSVPLPATGLTNGATYHVTLSQQGGDSINNYLAAASDADVYTGTGPTALYRARSGGSGWTATTAGVGIPVTVYDQTASGSLPLHLWADSGAKHDMLVRATTPDGTLLGYLEATTQPGPVLNTNPTFTTGTAPWTVTGGTLTQSSAQTQGNLPSSGLLTPSGSAATSDIESEKIPVYQGHNYVASAWLYSPTGYADVAVDINWYSAAGALLSTTSGTVTSVTAATWTEITTTGPVPAAATDATIVIAETGTPPTTALLYCYAAIQDTQGPMLPSVAQVDYTGSWPAAVSQPLGVTKLA